MALTHVQVLDAVAAIVEAGTSLVESEELLDPRNEPEAALNRAFSVVPSSISNTGAYRDAVGGQERAQYLIDLVCAWALNVHNYKVTRDVALGDALAIIQALCSDTSSGSQELSVYHDSTDFEVHDSREWLFASVRFTVDTDIAL